MRSLPAAIRGILRWIALALALLAIVAGLHATGWLGSRAGDPPSAAAPRPHVICGDCPYLYKPNPAHPEVSSQGLRDRDYAIPKPEGVLRILVLGDSVAFGIGVSREESFPKRLEERLRRRGRQVEVINAGVKGYTAYNEVHFYLSELRDFQPDVVLLAVVLNDAVNPRLHWNVFTESPRFEIPQEAIPNPEDDRTRLAAASRSQNSFQEHAKRAHEINMKGRKDASGRRWPVLLTGEDSIGIETLLDYNSAEWRWLRGLYRQLKRGVEADGAELWMLVLPLAYQLEEGYPFDPQPLFERFCRDESLVYLDPLPAFRAHPERDALFIGTDAGYMDVWHLTPAGHALLAEEIEKRFRARWDFRTEVPDERRSSTGD
jgi:lysophospholipase L1-like esterase